MFIKTNIPVATQSFDGTGSSIRGHNVPNEKSIPCPTKQIQASNPGILPLFGNRCGHDPFNLRTYSPPSHHKQRPSLIKEGIEKAKIALTKPKRYLKAFLCLNPSERQKRSERREAILSVTQAILHYLELQTLRVGFFTSHGVFIGLDLEYIAKVARINVERAGRAIQDMVNAGYLKVIPQHLRKANGTFAGLPSIREVTVQFLIELGIDVSQLFFAREWKRKKQEKMFARQMKKNLKAVVRVVTYAGSLPFSALKKISAYKNKAKQTGELSVAKKKELAAKVIELYKANPSRSCNDYYLELLSQLPQPP